MAEEEQTQKPKMIELSVQMDDTMNYNICIPSVITSEKFPEILKRIRAVISIIPKNELIPEKGTNPVLVLELEPAQDLFKKYKTMERKTFLSFLSKTYKLEYNTWKNVVSLMGRLKKRIIKLGGDI